MRDLKVIFTEHSLTRLTERSISSGEVVFTINNFTISYPTRRGGQVIECLIGDRILRVWFAYPINPDSENIVITAAWKGELK